MKKLLIAGLGTLLLAAAACGGDDDGGGNNGGGATAAGINAADFSRTVDNPLSPLSTLPQQVFEGEELDPETGETIATRVEVTVLDDEKTVAGVQVLVVRDDAYEDGELVESTLDYFAQHRDGSVYYFGEDVDNYEDGAVANHDGSWLAGEGENLPGVFMPAQPEVGQTFDQERAPGIAEDHSTVVAVGETVELESATYSGCIKTEDVNPLDGETEFKFYCPDVGFVREEFEGGYLELVGQ